MSATPVIGRPTRLLDLRPVFREVAASTWVIAGQLRGVPTGFTAISVHSVSADPPLVSFNLSRSSSSLDALRVGAGVALHLLADDQEPVARRFAGDRQRRFVDDGAWEWASDDLPQIHGVAARITARVRQLVEAGDSYLALAELEAGQVDEQRTPLVHYRAAYHSLR